MNPELNARLIEAFAEGEAGAYLSAYEEVTAQLEKEHAQSLLTSVVNNVLMRMITDNCSVHSASIRVMEEMSSLRSKYFVMAAAVDIALNERQPGVIVKKVATAAETLNRVG